MEKKNLKTKSESLCCTLEINKIVNQLFFKKTYSQLLPREYEKNKKQTPTLLFV